MKYCQLKRGCSQRGRGREAAGMGLAQELGSWQGRWPGDPHGMRAVLARSQLLELAAPKGLTGPMA